ncbi:DNA primase [Leeia sp.]|uniref:DNA primase n=1 Tax=Leeia sp. TaxID=2884678 RepID=UPI0035ADDAA2
MIPQSFIDDLLARADIVSVVDRYVPLKKTGINYSACCPFHQEKSPSFTVSPSKQFYHCFGCGAHGDALRFVMEYQGLGFIDAVKQLAADYGMTVPDVREEQAQQFKATVSPLIDVLQQASQHFRQQLKQSPEAIAYLKGRGLTGEVAARFGLGYAPDDWQGLAKVFADYPTRSALVESGLVIDNEQGRRYDRFRDRVMFPIHNAKGQIIGFGGRVMGKGEPKYLNSPETPLFQKGHELYGLYQARQAIKQAGKVLVVEGYMDVVALAQYGVEYAVATLGTSTTADHLHKLFRHSERLVFCFDGDNAGRKAAWRALENALPQLNDAVRLEFLFLPEGEDPDSLVRQIGKAGFEQKLEAEAEPLSRFLQRELAARTELARGDAEAKARFWHEAKPLLNQIAAPTLKSALWDELKTFTGMFRRESPQQQGGQKGRKPWQKQDALPPQPARTAPASNEERVLMYLLRRPGLWRTLPESVHIERCDWPAAGRALLDLLAASPKLEELDSHTLLSQAPLQWQAQWTRWLQRDWVTSLDVYSEAGEQEFLAASRSIWLAVESRWRAERKAELDARIQADGLGSLDEVERQEYLRLMLPARQQA